MNIEINASLDAFIDAQTAAGADMSILGSLMIGAGASLMIKDRHGRAAARCLIAVLDDVVSEVAP